MEKVFHSLRTTGIKKNVEYKIGFMETYLPSKNCIKYYWKKKAKTGKIGEATKDSSITC